MCSKTNQRLSTFQCKCSFPGFSCPEKLRWWDSNGPGACRGGGSVSCWSPCELVRDSTRTMSARSHCKITSSIAPSHCPPNYSCQGPFDPASPSPRERGTMCGCDLPGTPRLYLHLWPPEIPLRGHYMITADRAGLGSASGAQGFSWCEDGWALKFSAEAKSPARHAVRRTVVPLEAVRLNTERRRRHGAHRSGWMYYVPRHPLWLFA